MKYTTIFLDLDDTLIDTAANNYDALTEIYTEYKFDSHYESFDDFYAVFKPYNLSLWKLYEQNQITKSELKERRFFVPFKHISDLSQEKASEINEEFMFRSSSKKRIINGAIDFLDWAKPGFKIVMLSNGFKEVQYKKLENSGLTDYFDKIILSDHVGVNKPSPILFEYALHEASVKKDETIMIGDNWHSDITGAKNSGIDQIWYNPSEISENGFTPTYTIKSLDQIKNILNESL